MKRLLIVLAAFALTAQVHAHDVYVDASGLVVYGHPGHNEPYPADKLRGAQAIDANGAILPISIERRDDMSVVKADGAAVIDVDFDNGLFAKTPEAGKFIPGGRNEHPTATEVRNFVKYGKSVYSFGPGALKPSGAKFEIVPQAAPANGQLQVQVRFNGQPLGGAVLTMGDTNITADAQGLATLPHKSQALYTTRHEQAGSDGVDRIVYAAALWVAL